ncbi:DUF968 domain-containing protein [Ewingella sp. S1.OA.A_B6]
MRALLTPYPQRDASIVIFKPGTALMGLFAHKRLLISTVPEELKDFPIGEIPAVTQSLVDDQRLHGFFTNDRVINAAGGIWGMKSWLEAMPCCQWKNAPDGYHDNNLGVLDYDNSAVRLCWHHEHKLGQMILPELDRLAYQNLAMWVVHTALHRLKLPQGHQLSFFELCWWAVTIGVIDVMPDSAARHALRWKPAEPIKSVGRESDIVPEDPPAKVLAERTEPVKAVLYIAVDPETPESLMLRPKRRRWESAKYTQWVKRQPCCGCGDQADDPHHITGNGLGGMATKAHDLFVIPLCRRCHDALHANTKGWEEENGNQILLVLKTIDSALAMGVIATGRQK